MYMYMYMYMYIVFWKFVSLRKRLSKLFIGDNSRENEREREREREYVCDSRDGSGNVEEADGSATRYRIK